MASLTCKPESGFTLLEVLVAMVLMTVISAITAVSLAFFVPTLRLKSAAQNINLQVQKARLEAIRLGHDVHIEFHKTIGGSTFSPIVWIDKNDNDTMDSGEDVYRFEVSDVSTTATPVWEFVDYGGIRFNNSYDVDGIKDLAGNKFILNRRGLSDDAGSVQLLNARGSTKTILVTLGGAVRIY